MLHMNEHEFMKYLNLGCGSRYLDGWMNLDISPVSPYVQACNLLNGIPFPDNTFEFVYHSHLLEHIPRSRSADILKECCRVLKPGCVIRVVVPDLERITRLYLQYLYESIQGSEMGQHRYEWMMLELYDQTVRNCYGGEMSAYLQQDTLPDQSFILQRLGGEAKKIFDSQQSPHLRVQTWRSSHPGNWARQARVLAGYARDKIYRLFLGQRDYQALVTGRFRQSGEIHQWMYDRYSLAQALLQSGFLSPIQQTAVSSMFPEWGKYNLDIEPDGTVYKPDSLYMEAVKPA
jgi:predicted SAM-dependent methyltransferase